MKQSRKIDRFKWVAEEDRNMPIGLVLVYFVLLLLLTYMAIFLYGCVATATTFASKPFVEEVLEVADIAYEAEETTSFEVYEEEYEEYYEPVYSYSYTGWYESSDPEAELNAKEWIAQRESGGDYGATNGRYIGRYQLDSSYLDGDYSPEHQEEIAEAYVQDRYGSWEAAKDFWEQNGWY